MCSFSEKHSKLLSKEWLVKIDTQTSTPYLIKYHASVADLSCCVLITDTKSVWAEVLTSKQFARRWRDCNRTNDSTFPDVKGEDSWRERNLDVLSTAHTLGGIKDLGFELVDSHYADLAFELECETFQWRWEVAFVGYKLSAEILSKHLIMPLISLSHLAFSSADPVCELSESDLEKAVDKMARTARRTVDTHIKHAISKPRVATTIQRVTAMFNFASDLPAIISTSETPKFRVQDHPPPAAARHSPKPRSISPQPRPNQLRETQTDHADVTGRHSALEAHSDSATESDNEGVSPLPDQKAGKASASHAPLPAPSSHLRSPVLSPPPAPKSLIQNKASESDSESSPPRPVKKAKPRDSSSDEDSEAERKRRVAMLKGVGAAKRGTKQPLKRGGKRF